VNGSGNEMMPEGIVMVNTDETMGMMIMVDDTGILW
jgi:hypothetical protein